mmetsp:Transcript_28580/g.59865  ORF Transcript_28580/g.59865 Transcript_28580/m.59865 type:complete len:270 (+) Transcript_28580:1195-2004(+)
MSIISPAPWEEVVFVAVDSLRLIESLGNNLHGTRNIAAVHYFVTLVNVAVIAFVATEIGQGGADILFDGLVQIVVALKVLQRVETPLCQVIALVGIPASTTLDDVQIEGCIQHATLRIDPASKQDIEHDGFEGGSDLVLDDLDLDADSGVVWKNFLAAGVEADRRIKLECITTGGDLGGTINDTNLGAQLVQENNRALAEGQRTRDFSHCLGHQPSLEANLSIGHISLELGSGYQCGYAVHHNHIDRRRSDEFVDDVQGHFSAVGLAYQ